VHPQNPARYSYQTCGFTRGELRSTYWLMIAKAA
jgi:hypothetical protein